MLSIELSSVPREVADGRGRERRVPTSRALLRAHGFELAYTTVLPCGLRDEDCFASQAMMRADVLGSVVARPSSLTELAPKLRGPHLHLDFPPASHSPVPSSAHFHRINANAITGFITIANAIQNRYPGAASESRPAILDPAYHDAILAQAPNVTRGSRPPLSGERSHQTARMNSI